jgi:hypothetical protein
VDVVTDSADQDAAFTRVSDDNTEFQAAVELNNGDGFAFDATIENSAADKLDVQVAVDSPDPITIDVRRVDGKDSGFSVGSDVDLDDDGGNGKAVQTGDGTFVAGIKGTDSIGIFAELDDTADPGSYDIGVAINPLSTDN